MNSRLRKTVYAALFLALGLVLPFLTAQIPEIGNMLLPMHLPVMLCGLACGPLYGGLVGAVTPLFRSLLFGMPVFYPNALGMAFELLTYGAVIGILYRMYRKKNLLTLYGSLIPAMLAGRLVWGLAQTVLLSFSDKSFALAVFWTNGFANALPGILLQLILIPSLMLAIQQLQQKHK
ncbi:MAG: ECF transporter S component [Clostridia bacterium]|nr:ECF transporter S component [Clostridia bacterium]